MYVCLCKGITESKAREAYAACGRCPKLLATELGIDDDECCRRCIRNIKTLVTIASCEPVLETAG